VPEIVLVLSGLLGWLVYWLVRLDGFDVIAALNTVARPGRAKVNLEAAARAAARSVAEPRDGALALLVKLVSVDNVIVPSAEAIIDDAARDTFFYGNNVVEHRTFAEYVARNTPSFSVLFRELAHLFDKKLSTDERHDLLGLLHDVAMAAGMTSVREEMITKVRTRLLPEKRTRA
jgi:uncharacterized tellurite resistance protein B-like protein